MEAREWAAQRRKWERNLERGPEAYIWVLAYSFLFYFEKESLYIAQAVLECAVYTCRPQTYQDLPVSASQVLGKICCCDKYQTDVI